MSDRNSRESTNGDHINGARNDSLSIPTSPSVPQALPAASSPVAAPSAPPAAVENVLTSNIGISTLLDRLKQSIASARDLASFLKKRSSLEEEQANGLKRLVRAHLESIRRPDGKAGSYARQVGEMLRVHERMADNGMQFALSLHQMHEDLNELGNAMERGRKQWKHDGLDAEKRASDAESAMQKAKARYDSLAEQYDRAKTGDTKGSRRLGIKGPKSAEQHESDLLSKTQAADADYEEKVRQARTQREQLVRTGRPNAVKALRDLINECDHALTLQLQKYATFNEKLLLGNGLAVSPLEGKDAAVGSRSMRDTLYDIDNDGDFHGYVGSYSGKISRPSDIHYEQHPTLASKQQQPRQSSMGASSQPPTMSATNYPPSGGLAVNTSNSQPGSMNNRYSGPQETQPTTPSYSQTPQSASSQYGNQQPPMPEPYRTQQPAYNPSPQAARDPAYNSPPYPTTLQDRALPASPAGPRGGTSGYPPHSGGIISPSTQQPSFPPQESHAPPPPAHSGPPGQPIFGLSLQSLFDRDATPVPLIVHQSLLAIDTFGLDTEGIYRLSGTSSHVTQLRNAFNTLPPSHPSLDFRNPANFFHDVNSVATLLKRFFAELPDPLLTREGYGSFIEAARIEDEGARRDALHGCVNELPDANYATLRALVLHLHRVVQREGRNRMETGNLGICFAPTLMGQHNGQIGDAGLQARVLDTILINTTSIFDDD
nr:hypothetical protein B0A51_00422 [Rachicladosporium sp. CCFEE 5018]